MRPHVFMDANEQSTQQTNDMIQQTSHQIQQLARQTNDQIQQTNRLLQETLKMVQQLAPQAGGRQDPPGSRVEALEVAVNSLRMDLVRVQNRERRAFNRRIFATAGQLYTPLQTFLNAHAQIGPGIHGLLRVSRPQVPVGAPFPSPPFPTTAMSIAEMSLGDIHELAAMMNDDFGIVQGDDVHACRAKVARALAGE